MKMSRTSIRPAPSQRPRARAVLMRPFPCGLAVRDVDQFVLGETRVQDDIQQPAEPHRPDFRRAGDRLRVEHAVPDDPQAGRRVR